LKIVAKEIENLDRQALIISANVTKKEEVNLAGIPHLLRWG
jgi:hypothetical protein